MSPEPDCAVVSGILRPYEMSEVAVFVLIAKMVEPGRWLVGCFTVNRVNKPYRSSGPPRL